MADPFIGEIRLFPFNWAPYGWALCNGQTLTIQQNSALFAVISNAFGGDGVNNFMLPNFQGNIPMGTGTGPSLTPRAIGQIPGQNQYGVALDGTRIPSHNHTLTIQNTNGTATTANNSSYIAKGNYLVGRVTNYVKMFNTALSVVPLNVNAITSVGGSSVAHENRQPYLTLNFCIALQGIFPVRP